MKPDRTAVLTLSAAAIGLLLYALLGKPPYAYFGFMKIAVCAAALYVAWAVYSLSSKLALLSFGLAALGLMEMFGKMRREEWIPWNWATVAGFGLAALLIAVPRNDAEETD